MPSKEVLSVVLAEAVRAPSGDNSQPWEFLLKEDALEIYNRPGQDETLYNFQQRGSYVSHGAVIENISLLLREKGFVTNAALFPGAANCAARLTFSVSDSQTQPLARNIPARITNRKPYNTKKLELVHDEALARSVAGAQGATVRLLTDPAQIHALAQTLSLNERLLMENKPLHDFLFGMIRWTTQEEQSRPGLYVRTMEFPPPVRFLLRYVLCRWSVLSMLNRAGFSRLLARQTTALYRTSAAFGAVIIPSSEAPAFVQGGRALQRLWLASTGLGVAFQPVTGLPYLALRIREGGGALLSPEHQKMVLSADTTLRAAFGLKDAEQVALLFRLGYADAPSAHSAKLEPRYI